MQRKKGFFIKNILVIGGRKGQNGEHFDGTVHYFDKHPVIVDDGTPDHRRVKRIVEQITLLSEFATKNHHPERLTRLITDEFSFYTRSRPLTIEEYRTIISTLSDVLKNLPPNIVLIISSMPVLWPDGTLRNAVLHIQSPNEKGTPPIIHHLSKENFSGYDPYYARNTTAPLSPKDCYEFQPDDYSSEYSPDIVLQGTGVSCHSKNQYKNAIAVNGVNLRVIETIDICLDHIKQTALYNVKKLLRQLDDAPFHISHIITSNIGHAYEKALVSAPVHADWKNKRVGDVTEKKNELSIPYFGDVMVLHIYHQVRAEVLSGDEFMSAAHKMPDVFDLRISTLKDNYNNTLLHQILLPNKTTTGSPHQYRQLKTFNTIIPYFWGEAINQQNENGDTPLHLALKITNDENMLLTLLEHGARLDIKNKAGKSPLEWALENSKGELVHLLINKLINNINVYLAHQDTILTLINTLPDNELKKKVAASALCFEMSGQIPKKIDENKAIELLRLVDTSPVRLFIQHNISQLLSTFKKGMLYYYLVDNHALLENKEQITALPAALHAHLLELDLLRPSHQDSIELFKKGLTQLWQQFDAEERKNIQIALSDELKEFSPQTLNADNVDKQIIPILMENDKIANAILQKLPEIKSDAIKRKLLFNSLQQFVYVEMIKQELAKVTPNEQILCMSWVQLTNKDFCADISGLTLTEQILLHAYTTNNPKLMDFVVSRSQQLINDKLIDKMTHTQENNKKLAQSWFYQQLLENELKRHPDVHSDVLFFTLAHFPFINFNKPMYTDEEQKTNVAEQLICEAFLLKGSFLLDRVVHLLLHLQYDIHSIMENVIHSFTFDHQYARSWLYQTLVANEIDRFQFANPHLLALALSQPLNLDEFQHNGLTLGQNFLHAALFQNELKLLDQLKLAHPYLFTQANIDIITQHYDDKMKMMGDFYHALLKNEFKRGSLADLNLIVDAIHYCDLSKRSEMGALTIGEQLFAQAYLANDAAFLNYIKINIPYLFSQFTINNAARSFNDPILIEQWIYQTLITNEFKPSAQVDLDMIFFALSSSSPSTDLLNLPSGINTLTIGEQLFAHAYYANNPTLFRNILPYTAHLNLEHVFSRIEKSPGFPSEGIKWLKDCASANQPTVITPAPGSSTPPPSTTGVSISSISIFVPDPDAKLPQTNNTPSSSPPTNKQQR